MWVKLALNTLVLSLEDDMGKPGFEDAKYVFTAAAAKEEEPATTLEGVDRRCAAGGFHRPLSLSVCRSENPWDWRVLLKIPNGGPGIENRMQLAYHHGVNEGRMSLERFVEVTAEAPAKIFWNVSQEGGIVTVPMRIL